MSTILLDHPLLAVMTLREAWRRTGRQIKATPLHGLRIGTAAPARPVAFPPNLRGGDEAKAEAIYCGRFVLAGEEVLPGARSIFEVAAPSAAFAAELNGFDWLRHHAAVGDALAMNNARLLIDDWIRLRGRSLSGNAFEPAVAARRVIAWTTHAGALLAGADSRFVRRFMRSLGMQAILLRALAAHAPDGLPRLTTRIALAFASLCLPAAGSRLKLATRQLSDELGRQIFADGGHLSRDPAAPLAILPDLIALRETYCAAGKSLPKGLYSAIDRMLPALRFFSHGDGSLALFNGAGVTDPRLLATLLRFDETLGEPISHARHSGFHRLAAKGAVVIADTGCPPPAAVSGGAHAGTLSFELSSGLSRIVVNCGRPTVTTGEWRRVSRSTVAHSTASLDDRSSSRFTRVLPLDRFLGTPLVAGPSSVPTQDPTGIDLGFDAVHDGYEQRYGLLHRRRMELSPDGRMLEGGDRFEPGRRYRPTRAARNAVVRFHLHPSVSVETAGDNARLCLRDQTWLFCASAPFDIQDSVYFADAQGARRTLQIVVSFDPNDPDGIGWRFERER